MKAIFLKELKLTRKVLIIWCVIIQYVESINFLNFLSPFRYFNGLAVVNDGISLIYVLIAVVVSATSIYLAYGLYNKKDLLI